MAGVITEHPFSENDHTTVARAKALSRIPNRQGPACRRFSRSAIPNQGGSPSCPPSCRRRLNCWCNPVALRALPCLRIVASLPNSVKLGKKRLEKKAPRQAAGAWLT